MARGFSQSMCFPIEILIKLFENDKVKNSTDKDTKSLLRASKTPVEAIRLFDKLNG